MIIYSKYYNKYYSTPEEFEPNPKWPILRMTDGTTIYIATEYLFSEAGLSEIIPDRNWKLDTSSTHLEPATVGETIAYNLCRYLKISDGVYWDYELQKYVYDSESTPRFPQPSDEERKAMNKQIKRVRKKQKRRQDICFKMLYQNTIWIQEWSEQTKAKQQEKLDSGIELTAQDTEIPEYIQRIIKETQDIVSELGCNAIISFFSWSISELADEILTSPELRKKCLDDNAFTRNRDISLKDVFLFTLTSGGKSLSVELFNFFKYKTNNLTVTPAAMEQARQKITVYGFEYLYNRMVAICQSVYSGLCYKHPKFDMFSGINCLDGSDIAISPDINDTETYVKGKDENSKGNNSFHLNAICDALTGIFVNSVIQPKKQTHEPRAAIQMINEMSFVARTLLLADRGYGSLNFYETIRRKENLDAIIRVKEDWINEVKDLPLEEFDKTIIIHIITTQRKEDKERISKREAKYLSGVSKFGKYKKDVSWDYESEVDVELRVVRFKLSSGNWETLITTLSPEEFDIEKIKELYYLRWNGIEKAFRNLKWDTYLVKLHSIIRDLEKQEIYARLTMHNIVSTVISIVNRIMEYKKKLKSINQNAKKENGDDGKADAAEPNKKVKKRKHEYIINRHYATHVICEALKAGYSFNIDVIEEIMRHLSPVREGRSFKRNMRPIGFQPFVYR